jgi:hypothetical protein
MSMESGSCPAEVQLLLYCNRLRAIRSACIDHTIVSNMCCCSNKYVLPSVVDAGRKFIGGQENHVTKSSKIVKNSIA